MFKDIIGHWSEKVVSRLFRMGAIAGYQDGTFSPDKNVTRAEVASMIDKYNSRRWELVKSVVPSVIKVTSKLPNGKTSIGSGVILDKEGFIATNIHVVGQGLELSQDINVYLDQLPDTPFKAVVKYGDFSQDIAIIKIAGVPEKFLQPVSFAEKVTLLEDIFCIGNPLGNFSNSVTMGIVSFEDRQISGHHWIQTDSSINPGNSGGGAFNMYGELIGLPTFKMVFADQEKTIPVDNIGFITPWFKVKETYENARRGNVAFKGKLTSDFVMEC